jgi:hypothetical protein
VVHHHEYRVLLQLVAERNVVSRSRTVAILVLILAAGLEAGGDALVRVGLHSPYALGDISSIRRQMAHFVITACNTRHHGYYRVVGPRDFPIRRAKRRIVNNEN